jgi:hypothetical protein
MKQQILKVIILLSPVFLFGCYITKGTGKISNSDGVYRYAIIKGTGTGKPVVMGTFREFEVDKIIHIGALRSNKGVINKVKTDGSFLFAVPPGDYSFETRVFTYAICKTKKFKLESGDTLRLNFRIKGNSSPLY